MEHIAENRRARFDYEIKETLEAGIELKGFEVKSAKGGQFNLAGSHALIRAAPHSSLRRSGGGELWLLNSQIPAYQPKNAPADYDPKRLRRLLLHSEEIKRLAVIVKDKKFSLIPLRAYIKNNLIKIELGVGRPQKKSDKREVLKKRTHEREMGRLE